MNKIFKVLITVLSVAYPVVVFVSLTVFHASPRVIAFNLMAMGIIYFLANSKDAGKKSFQGVQFWFMVVLTIGLSVTVFFTDSWGLAKLYPVIMNTFLFLGFAYTIVKPPTMIFRFAQIQDKTILDSPDLEDIKNYTKKVTIIWCIFFVFNGAVAAITSQFASDFVWSLYNGLISYVLIGVLIVGEMIVRKFVVGR